MNPSLPAGNIPSQKPITVNTVNFHFRTIKPPAYPGRTPHIHVAVSHRNKRILTTQMYIEGEKQNASDFLYKRLGGGDPKLQKLVTIPFTPLKGSKAGELTARLDLVVGLTPQDPGKTERDGQPRRQKRR